MIVLLKQNEHYHILFTTHQSDSVDVKRETKDIYHYMKNQRKINLCKHRFITISRVPQQVCVCESTDSAATCRSCETEIRTNRQYIIVRRDRVAPTAALNLLSKEYFIIIMIIIIVIHSQTREDTFLEPGFIMGF